MGNRKAIAGGLLNNASAHTSDGTPRAVSLSILRERLRAEFYAAPEDALLNQDLAAVALNRSVAWCELKRCKGGGPPFVRLGRRCLYRKAAILKYLADDCVEVSRLQSSTKE